MNEVVHYPRNVAKSELCTRRNIPNENNLTEVQLAELQNKLFAYNCAYAYLMDAIAYYCTRFRDEGIGKLTYSNKTDYYTITVTPNELEFYALGEYKNNAELRAKFWHEFNKVFLNQATLVMFTDEGVFGGLPIILSKEYATNGINRHGGNTQNLKQQSITLTTKTIKISFFRPMFKAVVQNGTNWIPLPRNLQAILDYKKMTTPSIFTFKYKSNFDIKKTYALTTQTMRKYFLFMTSHNNNIGKEMHFDAIAFFNAIKQSEVQETFTSYENDKKELCKKHAGFYLRNWYFCKQAVDAMACLHSKLVKQGLLAGINFTTCRSSYNKDTQQFTVAVYREKPLAKAPDYIGIGNAPPSSNTLYGKALPPTKESF